MGGRLASRPPWPLEMADARLAYHSIARVQDSIRKAVLGPGASGLDEIWRATEGTKHATVKLDDLGHYVTKFYKYECVTSYVNFAREIPDADSRIDVLGKVSAAARTTDHLDRSAFVSVDYYLVTEQ